MRVLVIPNDPIKAYLKKGELIRGYFNPDNIFSHVDILSLDDTDLSADNAGHIAGGAELRILPSGKVSFKDMVFPGGYVKKMIKAVGPFAPDMVIAHNAHLGGYLATYLGEMYKIPVVIYLHTNLDKDVRAHIGWSSPIRKLFWSYSSMVMEPRSLKKASRVIAAYGFAALYATDRGFHKDRIDIIYHRIDIPAFKAERVKTTFKKNINLKILCVGRIFERKNPENIIRALKKVDATLTIIGDGPLYGRMEYVAQGEGVRDRVKFIKSVPNAEIGTYYRDADVFASVNDYGGVSKPVMEAMASSLPIVLKNPMWEEAPELVSDFALVCDGTSRGFASAFRELAADNGKRLELGRKAFEMACNLSGNIMEKKEAEVLSSIVRGHR